ncbi:hypothetical protein G4B88_022235 [Cannabis sativa]|uniref:Uncharacterized protein n=1 Tax=Cannabis sativa TaxID=3483 RepID=A0A7J6FY17_CANSA|nr:hypothetical protein G4B88_022235 [Cannabis sativa]
MALPWWMPCGQGASGASSSSVPPALEIPSEQNELGTVSFGGPHLNFTQTKPSRGFLGLAGSVAIATVACKTIAISRLTDLV